MPRTREELLELLDTLRSTDAPKNPESWSQAAEPAAEPPVAPVCWGGEPAAREPQKAPEWAGSKPDEESETEQLKRMCARNHLGLLRCLENIDDNVDSRACTLHDRLRELDSSIDARFGGLWGQLELERDANNSLRADLSAANARIEALCEKMAHQQQLMIDLLLDLAQ